MLGGLIVAGALLRFATLDLQSFWVDEGATVHLLRGDLGGLLDGIPVTEKTPPLYYLLAWLWTRPFGTGEVGVRSLSALVGTLTLPVVFALGRTLVSQRAGLIATAIAAVNPLLVWYSQEARAYALLVLLTGLAVLFFVRAREEDADPRARTRALAWWAGVSALALATHYFALFVVGPLAAWLVLRPPGGPPGRGRSVRAVAGVAVAGAALLPLAIDQSHNTGSNFITGTALGTRLLQVPKQFLLGYDAPAEVALTAVAALLAAAGLGLALVRTEGRERSGARVALAVLAASLAVPFVVAVAGADFVLARNAIGAWIPMAVVLGAGLGARRAGALGIALAAGLCALSLACVIAVFTTPEYQRDDWRGVADALGPARMDRALVVNPVAGQVPLGLYLDGLGEYPQELHPVTEIDIVAVTSRQPGQTPRPPRPASPSVPGFRVVDRRDEDTFTLVRLRAAEPVPIAAPQLIPLRLARGQAATQLQTAGGR
jgi:hypothetical protein